MPREREFEDEEMEDGPSSPKRFRPSSQIDLDNEEEEEDQNLIVGDDGFVEGSIVKITLKNFVTYDYCEILPGPQMNMIIGPNGTGKSTIVCAITLGLGGSPALLGRAKNIAEFVKTGEDEATICIELKMVKTRNIIIQRTFKKVDNTNIWRKNDRVTSLRDILNTVRELNIQVDNLCQLLPQDRVSEFAELSPSQLLERTQAATGEIELHDMQKKLMEWRNKEKDLEKSQASDLDHLKTLQTRNAESEKDVFRMQQRAEILNNISLLEAQIPLIKYSDAKNTVDEVKNRVNIEKEKVETIKADLAPTQSVIKECDTEARKMARKFADENLKFREQEQRIKAISNDIQSARESIKATKTSIESTREKIPTEERKIEMIKAQIQKLEDVVKNPPSNDYSHFENAISEINEEASELHNQSLAVNQKLRDAGSKRHNLDRAMRTKKDELKEVDNALFVRLNKIKRMYPDVVEAFQFCKNNPDKFVGRIHGPVVLAVNVKDVRYAAMIEQVLGGAASSHLRYFICENAEDYRTFTRLLVDEKKLKVNVTWPNTSDDVLKTPTTEAELQSRVRMDHYAVNLLEGDPHVIRYLAKATYLNLIPLALKHSREEDVVSSGLYRKFCIGETFYNVKISEYGRRSKQTSTTPLRPAEYFGDSVDREAKSALLEEIRSMEASLQQADVVMKEYNVEHDKIKQKIEECKHKKEDLVAQKRDIQRAAQEHAKKVHALERAKNELEESKKRPQMLLEKITKLEKEIEEIKGTEEELVQDYIVNLKTYVEYYERRNMFDLQKFFATEKFNAINTYCREQTKVLQIAEQTYMHEARQLVLAQREAQRYMRDCEDAGNNLTEELHIRFQEILRVWRTEGASESLDSLEQKIAQEKARVEAIRFANPNAMRNYEDRKRQIELLEQKIEASKSEILRCRDEIALLRAVWEPRIDKLVAHIGAKFSEAFKRIKCNGEIDVDKHEDFDKWGINIRVRFRDSEKLQLLTGQRQSGGERSVTTVLYLMSLQNLAKSPFRVVDEINQGMDPRNERMIHEQIVLGASKPGTSQYFLITPKLLPNLFYNERMRVLCIYNSEWLPTKIQPLSYYLENARANGVA